jgi:hypothetical protein
MTIPAEFQLAAAIIAIYLLDCLALLYFNEGIVERFRQRWSIGFGSAQPWVAGKRIALLNPLTPHVPAWKAAWHVRDAREADEIMVDAEGRLLEQCRALQGLRAFLWPTWFFVLIALPISLSLRITVVFLITAIIAWSAVWILIIRMWFLRKSLNLSGGAFALVAFECLVCPPNAANLIRRLSMRHSIRADLLTLSGMLASSDRIGVIAHIERSVAARQHFLEVESEAFARSERYLTLLADVRADDVSEKSSEERAS